MTTRIMTARIGGASGRRTSTCVPSPGALVIVTSPPSSDARSRRPSRPYELGLRGSCGENPTPSSRMLSAQIRAVALDGDLHPRSLRMLADVRERFLDDPEHRGRVRARQLQLRAVHRQLTRDAGALREGLRQPFDRGHEAQVVEHQRTQIGGDPPRRRDGLFQHASILASLATVADWPSGIFSLHHATSICSAVSVCASSS